MKIKIRLISMLLLISMIISSVSILSSCALIKSAKIGQKIDEAMESLSSYRADTEIKMIFYVDGKQVTSTSEGITIESGRYDDSDYYFYNSVKTTVKSLYLEIEQSSRNIEAYNEGTYFVYRHDKGGMSGSVCGELAVDDFKAYISKKGSTNANMGRCKKVKTTKNDDNTKTIEFSGFEADEVRRFTGEMGISRDIFNYDVEDIVMRVTYDQNYAVSSIEYDFIFDVYDKAMKKPSMNMKITYSELNSAERIYTNISPQQYTKVDNMKVLIDIVAKLRSMRNADEGEFDLNVYQTGGGFSYTEKNDIKYGYRDGKYFYDIVSDNGGQVMELSYFGGVQKKKIDYWSEENDQSEVDAKKFIDTLIDSLNFSILNVTAVSYIDDPADKELGEERYIISLIDVDKQPYQEIAAKLGGQNYSNLEHTVVALYKNGELSFVSSAINIYVNSSRFNMEAVHIYQNIGNL